MNKLPNEIEVQLSTAHDSKITEVNHINKFLYYFYKLVRPDYQSPTFLGSDILFTIFSIYFNLVTLRVTKMINFRNEHC